MGTALGWPYMTATRALGELLGTGKGAGEALLALEEVEGVLRSLAALINRIG